MKQQSLPRQIRWNYSFVVVDYGGIAIVCAVSPIAPSNQVMPRECPGDGARRVLFASPFGLSACAGPTFLEA